MLSTEKKSSNSEVDASNATIDEKKRKRMISKRESARLSRIRRQKKMEDLINEKAELERKLHENNENYTAKWHFLFALESENKVLGTEEMGLKQYLKYLHQILVNYKETESNNYPEV
ncbi:hypothetical protein P3X46_034893 [Hevea brasiliensis]|uniref:BZIP domain-containing protein n=1 Tax=Hevea brasiliensis TaxID=3981 RepID=A0ABQ9K7I2_HEVBR|nr:basic leucine zipper 1-like [Hevea brasiliensis]KAJ9128547.1 hypothetical protein P3X46_034893 [Hevea brasiliensis]